MSGQVTDAMVEAGASILRRMELAFASEEYWAKEVYRAMLFAAPASPQPQGADSEKCVGVGLCAAIRKESIGRRERIDWLEGLFDFSDPEIVLNSGPNDPVTKDAVVVLRSHYEKRTPAQSVQIGDKVEILNGKYQGAHGFISHVYPCPRYLRVKLIGGKVIERVTNTVKLLEAAQPITIGPVSLSWLAGEACK